MLGVGEVLPFSPTRRRAASLPVDVARTVEEALTVLPLDVVHVHEPFAPSAASVALRTARALSVATFHNPTERVLSAQIGRQLTQLVFSRLDARAGPIQAARVLDGALLPGRVPCSWAPAAEPVARIDPRPPVAQTTPATPWAPLRVTLVAEEERAALRTFLRALRLLPSGDRMGRRASGGSRPLTAPATLSRQLGRAGAVPRGELKRRSIRRSRRRTLPYSAPMARGRHPDVLVPRAGQWYHARRHQLFPVYAELLVRRRARSGSTAPGMPRPSPLGCLGSRATRDCGTLAAAARPRRHVSG